MNDWSRHRMWDDMVQAHIREGQECHLQGETTAADEHFCMALEALVRGYQDTIAAFCRNMLRGHADKAEDIAQEVFFAAWRTLPNFRHQASIRTWIFSIARNQCRDAWRKRTRVAYTEGTGENEKQEVPDSVPSPEEQYVHQDFLAWIKRGLIQLRGEDREVLVMTYIAELPRSEIASLLGIAETSVGTRRKRALQRLREVINYEKR